MRSKLNYTVYNNFSFDGCILLIHRFNFLCFTCKIKLVDKFSYRPMMFHFQPASFNEIQKLGLSHHLLASVSFIAEVTSDVEADNWSGMCFSQTQRRPSKSLFEF